MDSKYQDIHITNGKDTDVFRKVRIYGMYFHKEHIDIVALDEDRNEEAFIIVPKLPGYKITID